jgi:hypothetical protein
LSFLHLRLYFLVSVQFCLISTVDGCEFDIANVFVLLFLGSQFFLIRKASQNPKFAPWFGASLAFNENALGAWTFEIFAQEGAVSVSAFMCVFNDPTLQSSCVAAVLAQGIIPNE